MSWHRLKHLILRCWAISVLIAVSAMGRAEPLTTLSDGAIGHIEFQTYTPASQRPLITRSYLGDPATVISGVLTLPTNSPLQREGKSPAVILAHGTGGVSDGREHAWAKRLNSWGIAAFVVDSYTGRGIKPPIYADSPRFPHVAAHLVDAYLALQLISTHPRIDANRVAVMGFSRGGELAVNAVFERFRFGAIGAAPNRFAAYIPFYPYCNFRHVGRSLATAPMLMLLGGADEMTEPNPCENLAAWLKVRGQPVRVILYPGAHHGFDRLRPVTLDRAFVGIRKCEAEYNLDTFAIRRLDTGAPLATKEANDAWLRECRHKGARFGGDAKAREAAVTEVRAFLLRVFSGAPER
jgi:dienelactone hydrolase